MAPRTVCRQDNPIPCEERYADRDQFAFLPRFGWVWLRSHDVTRRWERCPYCWGKLPQMEGIVERASQFGWNPRMRGEPWSNGEGGE